MDDGVVYDPSTHDLKVTPGDKNGFLGTSLDVEVEERRRQQEHEAVVVGKVVPGGHNNKTEEVAYFSWTDNNIALRDLNAFAKNDEDDGYAGGAAGERE